MKKILTIFLLFFLPVLSYSINFSHTGVTSFTIGDTLNLKLEVGEKVNIALIFYKTGDNKQYQVRKMKKNDQLHFFYSINSKYFTAKKLAYHFVVLKNKKYTRYPESDIIAIGSGNLIKLPKVSTTQKPFPISLSGNFQGTWAVYSKETLQDYEKSSKNGNLSINGNFAGKNSTFTFSTTGTYTPSQSSSQNTKEYNISTVSMNYQAGNHTLKAGDLSFQAPDLALSAYGKRGMYYKFEKSNLGLNIFSLSSQQISGLGLPKKNSMITGGKINYKLGHIKLYTLYLSGKDDPTAGQNSSYSFTSVRQGSILSSGFTATLFNYAVNLNAAYFISNYTKDLLKEEKTKDHALSSSVSVSYKGLSLSSQYKKIGANYNSVGTGYLSNNQKTLNNSLSYSFSKITLSSSYAYMKSNIAGLENVPESTTNNINTSISFNLGKFSLGVGYQNNKQETEVEENIGIASEINATQYTINVSIMPSSRFSLNLSGGKSLNSSIDDQTSYSFNGSLSISLGSVFSLSPSMTYLKTEKNGDITKNITSYLNYQIVFFPKFFTLSGNLSYQKSDSYQDTFDSESLSVSSRLSFLFGWIWQKLGQSSFYIEGSYLKNKSSSAETDNIKVFASLVISF
jgi:hypothetical protein